MTMAEEQRGQRGGQPKGRRSASICAPGLSSMEEAMMASASSASALPPPPAIETTNATPRSARRRPATRSQSARATASGGKPRVKRREGTGGGGGSRAGSEPRLDATTSISASSSPRLQRRATARPHIPVVVTDGDGYDDPPLTATAAARRRRSLRVTPTSGGVPSSPSTQWKRGTSMKGTKSKGSFLDVPGDDSRSPLSDEDDESYRLRSFSLTSKGVVNRGDSFRRRRSRSNSLLPPGQQGENDGADGKMEEAKRADGAADGHRAVSPDPYRVAMVGTQGVGKTALISQFMTSECINAYDRQSRDEPTEQSVSVMLNGEESELWFINVTNSKTEIDPNDPPDAFVVMYSVIDKASFQRAEDELERLQEMDWLRSRPAILVGNKVDLVRSRAVSTQDGKCLACTYRAKFIEISVGINHNVDELLVGILSQIRLKNEQFKNRGAGDGGGTHWYKSRGMVRASMKARQVFTWLFGKEDSKFKNCENLHVL